MGYRYLVRRLGAARRHRASSGARKLRVLASSQARAAAANPRRHPLFAKSLATHIPAALVTRPHEGHGEVVPGAKARAEAQLSVKAADGANFVSSSVQPDRLGRVIGPRVVH
jgi:hypothetical protein